METDEEDHPDYDNVLGYFPEISPLAAKSRSRTSSYADLQRLRMTGGNFPS